MSDLQSPNTDILIYTKNNCPQCDATKKLFAKLSIEYSEINIEENPEVLDFLKDQGFRSAPVVFTEKDSWSGFNEAKVRSLADKPDTSDDDWDF